MLRHDSACPMLDTIVYMWELQPLADVPWWALAIVFLAGVWAGGPRKGKPTDDRGVR